MEWEKGMNQIYIKNGYVKSQTKVSSGGKKNTNFKKYDTGEKIYTKYLSVLCVHSYICNKIRKHDEEKEKQL